jgi:hypothetical protein
MAKAIIPKGERCEGEVWDRYGCSGCMKRGTLTENGKRWCHGHAPSQKKARRESRSQQWASEAKEREAQWKAKEAAERRDAARLALYPKLVDALRESIRYSPFKGESEETPMLRNVRALLREADKIEGGKDERA